MGRLVKARIRFGSDGLGHIEIQRGKYKHWFEMGRHIESDAKFKKEFEAGKVVWVRKIIEPPKLF